MIKSVNVQLDLNQKITRTPSVSVGVKQLSHYRLFVIDRTETSERSRTSSEEQRGRQKSRRDAEVSLKCGLF